MTSIKQNNKKKIAHVKVRTLADILLASIRPPTTASAVHKALPIVVPFGKKFKYSVIFTH